MVENVIKKKKKSGKGLLERCTKKFVTIRIRLKKWSRSDRRRGKKMGKNSRKKGETGGRKNEWKMDDKLIAKMGFKMMKKRSK